MVIGGVAVLSLNWFRTVVVQDRLIAYFATTSGTTKIWTMTTRKKIEQRVKRNLERIKKLELENTELKRQAMLMSDEDQWFTEDDNFNPKMRYKGKPVHSVGRVHWKESVIDEDTGDVIELERCKTVRINGEWVC